MLQGLPFEDVVETLSYSISEGKEKTVWIDAHNRLWETTNGVDRELIGEEKMKVISIFGITIMEKKI